MTSTLRREGLWVAALAWIALAAWTLWAGKEVGWDLINHHLYLPFALVEGRYHGDLFAASTQSYQNAIGYLPFHAALQWGLPDWGVGLVLVSLHAGSGACLWMLAAGMRPAPQDWPLRATAVALGLVSPIFLLNVGTSSTDPLSTCLVLVAMALLWRRGQHAGWMACAGAAFGLALSVKPTNAVLIPGLAVAAALRLGAGPLRARALAAGIGAAVLVACATTLPWAWWLWTTFGNPTYPFLNDRFQSPLGPQGAMIDLRFLPHSAWDLLTRPFDIATPRGWVHTEAIAPDLRPAALLLACAAALAVLARRGLAAPGAPHGGLRALWPRSDAGTLGVWLALTYVAWLLGSGNSRYVMAMFMLAGVLLPVLLSHLWGNRAALVVSLGLLATQAAMHLHGADIRYTGQSWTGGPYLDLQMPARLQREPVLHLSVGAPSLSGLATAMHPQGAFVNLIGPFSLPDQGPLAQRLQQRLEQWKGRTRFLVRMGELQDTPDGRKARSQVDRAVYRFGLAVDWQDCETIRVFLQSKSASGKADGKPTTIVSCAAIERRLDDPGYAAERDRADQVFQLIETQCPRIFGPRPLATDAALGVWKRQYMNSGARVSVSMEEGVGVTHFRSIRYVSLGTVDEVTAGRGMSACQAWEELHVQ